MDWIAAIKEFFGFGNRVMDVRQEQVTKVAEDKKKILEIQEENKKDH